MSNLFAKCGCGKGEGDESSPAKKVESPEAATGRAQWSSPTEFLLTCIGYSVGLGNVWRFPYLCYKSGGGAFLIPYMIMMCLIGMPLLFMEYSFGQYFGVGGLTIFKKVCPMFQGVGIGYMVLNGLVCIYYNVIIAMSLYYLFSSFQSTLPWASCDNAWNTPYCGDPIKPRNESIGNWTTTTVSTAMSTLTPGEPHLEQNHTFFNYTHRVSPSDEFFRLSVLDVHDEHNINNLGSIQWKLAMCLLLAWILVIIFVSRGIKSTGKVAYFTATFPYLMLTVLVVRGVTLEGASKGILYFVTPKWSMLKRPEVWFGAASQLFYSTNLAWGGMITMASYNTFNHNCYRDAIMINFVSFFTSLYAGFAVFSIIGYMANEYGIEVSEVIKSGPGLAFIVYPRALSLMPLAPMWSALFFFMLFLLGVGSQMVLIETVVTGIVDEYPAFGRNGCIRLLTTIFVAILFMALGLPQTTQMVQVETIMTGIVDRWPQLGLTKLKRFGVVIAVCSLGLFMGLACTTQMVDLETVMSGLCDEFPFLRKHRFKTLLIVSFTFFFLGLPQVTQGGMYVLQLMDWYSAGFSVLFIAVIECLVINWIYGFSWSTVDMRTVLLGNTKFAANVKEMLGSYPKTWWRICWQYISPVIIVGILVFSFVKYERAKYGETYTYPLWADSLGWVMVMSSVAPIFIVALVRWLMADGNTLREKFVTATKPQIDILDQKPMKSPIEEKVENGDMAAMDPLMEKVESSNV